MQHISLNIGEVRATRKPANIYCHGLGSCIGVFIYDNNSSITGGAHIMLPGIWDEHPVNPTCFSFNAIDQLLNHMRGLGSDLRNLRAKIVGGANVTSISSIEVGKSNIDAIEKELAARSVFISGTETGGEISRTAVFESKTRELEVTSKQVKSYKLKI